MFFVIVIHSFKFIRQKKQPVFKLPTTILLHMFILAAIIVGSRFFYATGLFEKIFG